MKLPACYLIKIFNEYGVILMKVNMSKMDRSVRIPLGILILLVGVYYQSWWGAIGLIPLLTGLVGFCPLYSIFGVSTSKKTAGV
ncbi:MAG: DUF2892 domain-containing protein [Balneolaceae bacterium]